jgi:hypothetical protein
MRDVPWKYATQDIGKEAKLRLRKMANEVTSLGRASREETETFLGVLA